MSSFLLFEFSARHIFKGYFTRDLAALPVVVQRCGVQLQQLTTVVAKLHLLQQLENNREQRLLH